MNNLEITTEFIGVLASVLVIISFLMKGERKIRIFNIFGVVAFIVYGILINSVPVWSMNTVLLGIHIYRIYIINEQTKYLKSKIGVFYTHDNKYIKRVDEEEN